VKHLIPGRATFTPAVDVRARTIGEGLAMAAPSLIVPLPQLPAPTRDDFFAEASMARVRRAAGIARDRLAEIDGVRVIGPEVAGGSRDVRLAMDLRDTGRDAWDVACAMAGRGLKLDAASNRVIVIRLNDADLDEGIHERLAPALLMALWATPAH
jgi:hypothetical protein